jgi:serine O-acetyltransferase
MKRDSFSKLLYHDLIMFSKSKNNDNNYFLWTKIIHPRFIPVLFIRVAFFLNKFILTKPLSYLFTFLNIVLFGIEVTPKCYIGKGLYIPHTFGTVIGARQIGDNVTIFQGVTIGAKYADTDFTINSRPIIGNRVMIGAGAKILGNISIGNHSIISANSLVISDVPDGVTMIGVPALVKN